MPENTSDSHRKYIVVEAKTPFCLGEVELYWVRRSG